MSKEIRWTCKNDEIKFETISKVQDILIVIFPKDFVEIAMKNDGAYPQPNRFEVNGSEEVFNNLLSFNEDDCSNIIDTFNDVKDRLIEKIIPFAEDPFGNLICFDYRDNSRPTVVFWEHERAFNNKETATSYICDTFSEFLNMLHEPEE